MDTIEATRHRQDAERYISMRRTPEQLPETALRQRYREDVAELLRFPRKLGLRRLDQIEPRLVAQIMWRRIWHTESVARSRSARQ